ncbi:hypothetical protein BJ170DRAFT_594229 [Xylariales sp. AK1849]|nr:hypothetical protein BJ170DRAFT_594229 [Xylariales sp. AK1849]
MKPVDHSELEVHVLSEAPKVHHTSEAPEAVYTPSEKIPYPDMSIGSSVSSYLTPQSELPHSEYGTSSRKSSCSGVAVVIALVCGLAGGLMSRHGQPVNDTGSGNANATNATAPTWGPLRTSQIAALNYTDSSNSSRRAVFYLSGGLKDTVLHAADNSRLGAAENFCNPSVCSNAMSIMYQDEAANVMLANGSNCQYPLKVDVGYPGASLAIVPFNKDSGSNFTWVTEVRMFYYSNVAVRMYSYDWEGLVPEANPIITNQEAVRGQAPQVAASTSSSHSQSVTVSMDGDGNFTTSFYDYRTGWQHSQSPQFKNQGGDQSADRPSAGVTSIAMDNDGSLYGIVLDGSRISRYAWDPAAPFTFTWAENVSVDG